jgi:hypothetical protein
MCEVARTGYLLHTEREDMPRIVPDFLDLDRPANPEYQVKSIYEQ